jgi:hypothetical protein
VSVTPNVQLASVTCNPTFVSRPHLAIRQNFTNSVTPRASLNLSFSNQALIDVQGYPACWTASVSAVSAIKASECVRMARGHAMRVNRT